MPALHDRDLAHGSGHQKGRILRTIHVGFLDLLPQPLTQIFEFGVQFGNDFLDPQVFRTGKLVWVLDNSAMLTLSPSLLLLGDWQL